MRAAQSMPDASAGAAGESSEPRSTTPVMPIGTPAERDPSADAGSEPDQMETAGSKPGHDAEVGPENDCEFHELRASEDRGARPYRVAADAGNLYHCFVFDLQLTQPTQGLAFYPIIDNTKILHHFLLYQRDALDTSAPEVDCEQATTADAVVVAGWAPGAGDWVLPDNVGISLGTGRFMLEVHYSNNTGEDQSDQSGVKICATRNIRPNTATISWLGNQLFFVPPHVKDYQVQGRCAPTSKQPIHVLRSWPHMHRLGKRVSMVLDRADGTRETVYDVPFSFDDQKQYDTPLVLNPGDSLLTTCYYDNPNDRVVQIGLKTTDEMCHNYVIAYPAGALSSQSPNQLTNGCLGAP